jgi:hypothetical protein
MLWGTRGPEFNSRRPDLREAPQVRGFPISGCNSGAGRVAHLWPKRLRCIALAAEVFAVSVDNSELCIGALSPLNFGANVSGQVAQVAASHVGKSRVVLDREQNQRLSVVRGVDQPRGVTKH